MIGMDIDRQQATQSRRNSNTHAFENTSSVSNNSDPRSYNIPDSDEKYRGDETENKKSLPAEKFLHVVRVQPDDPEKLNMRNGPGQHYEIVTKIPWNGHQIRDLGEAVYNGPDLWLRIRWGGIEGWVHSDYLEED